jgi:hypothetical protein
MRVPVGAPGFDHGAASLQAWPYLACPLGTHWSVPDGRNIEICGWKGLLTTIIGTDDPRAVAVVVAIRAGDTNKLRRLLVDHPELATAELGTIGGMCRSLLHVATDWPGHYPNGPATIAILISAGADVHARFAGPHTETPLHWAASSDDVDVLDALLDAGADIEADGAVIAGGRPLDDAVAFGQWPAARRLAERGAHCSLFNAAALGLRDRVREHLATKPPAAEITSALWASCHGGQEETALCLLEQGADVNWIAPWDGQTPLDVARRHRFDRLAAWLIRRGALPAGQVKAIV